MEHGRADWIDPAEVATIWDLVDRRRAATPDRAWLLDEHDGVLTFGEAADRAERVAAGLAARGVGPGHVVLWQLPSAIETVVLTLALARLGVVQCPVIPVYREREVAAMVRQTGATHVVVRSVWRDFDHAAMVAAVRARQERPFEVLLADDGLPEADPATLPPPPAGGDEVRWLYSTSGTTSEPKGVRHTDRTLLAGSAGLAHAYDPGPGDVTSIPFPVAHIGGPLATLLALQCGCPTVLLETFVPDAAVEVFRRHGVTMSGGSTAFYLAFLQQQRAWGAGERVLPALRMLYGGGAPKPPEVFWQVLEELHVPVQHGYGMTECPMIASGTRTDALEQLAETEGAPVVGCELRVVDADDRPLPPGAVGDLQVRGPMLFRGYTDDALTAAAFTADGWFRTGDLGRVRTDGHVVLTGRAKDMIIRKGENLSPREIEDVLHEHPRVAAAAVIGLPDPERGERVCAVVELRPGAGPVTLDEVREHCRAAGLMVQKTPEQLEVVDVLPRNATMKVLKHELRARFG